MSRKCKGDVSDFPEHVRQILKGLHNREAQVIEALEALALLKGRRRRGEPPAWMTDIPRKKRKRLSRLDPPTTSRAGAALKLPRDWRTVKVWAVSGRKPL
jgi:hypothetical protein